MMQQYRSNSYLFGGNAPYVEELYEAYLDNPGSVPDNWRDLLRRAAARARHRRQRSRDVAHAPVVEPSPSAPRPTPSQQGQRADDLAVARKQVHVQSLIAAYRFLGSRWADLDPLKRTERPKIPELEPAFYDLTESDMDIIVLGRQHLLRQGREHDPARDRAGAARNLLRHHRRRVHVHHRPGQKRWWQEAGKHRSKPHSAERRSHILDRLTAAEGLERYLHTKYVGQKRFSLEGGESFIAAMDELIQRAGEPRACRKS
jgi:2-oxoglutarate dehydrogenase E1 component